MVISRWNVALLGTTLLSVWFRSIRVPMTLMRPCSVILGL